MSKISDKLNIISNAKDDIKTAIENKGVSVGEVGIQDYASKIDEIIGSEVYPTLQEKTVVPTNEVQEVTPDEGIYGLSKVTVDKVNLQNKTVTPSSSEQIVKADSEYNGLNEVVVNGDDNLISENIVEGKTIFGVDGTAKTGGGGTPVEKGLIMSEYNSDGKPIKGEIIGMTEIPNNLFYSSFGNSGYFNEIGKNLTISNNLTKIGTNGFYGCTTIYWSEIPDSIIELGSSCFYNCMNLTLSKLPDSITKIGGSAFYGCKKITINEIPESITQIDNSSFYDCDSITEMTIKGNITYVGSSAFQSCGVLTKIVIPNITSVPYGGLTMFSSTPIASGTGYIYVPDDLVDSFKSATNWSTYADQIKGVSEL